MRILIVAGQPMIEDAGELVAFDTLEFTRRGRQEQARVVVELLSAALARLGQVVSTIASGVTGASRPHMNEGLKGN